MLPKFSRTNKHKPPTTYAVNDKLVDRWKLWNAIILSKYSSIGQLGLTNMTDSEVRAIQYNWDSNRHIITIVYGYDLHVSTLVKYFMVIFMLILW